VNKRNRNESDRTHFNFHVRKFVSTENKTDHGLIHLNNNKKITVATKSNRYVYLTQNFLKDN